jgi:hypothetical protein
MEKSLSIILKDLSASQKTKSLQRSLRQKIPVPVSIFQLANAKNQININCATLPITNLSSIWNNTIVFTTFDEGIFGTKCPTNSRRIFYMWDLDWQQSGYDRDTMRGVIAKCDDVILRSEQHIKPFKSFFGRNVDIINEDFNLPCFTWPN